MWKQTIQIMQNWTGCSSLKQEETITMKDSRDGNLYTVAKLKDGRCWMTQNLKISNITISSSDSNVISGTYRVPSSTSSWNYTNSLSANEYAFVDSYGGYYSWVTATAGQGAPAWPQNSPTTQSICPKGWVLPSQSEATTLISQYSSNLFNPPANHIQKGTVSHINNQVEDGSYWIALKQANGSNCLAGYNFSYSGVNAVCQIPGYSIRCISR